MTTVCFIPTGDITNAGSRMRAYWPAQFMPDATVATWEDIHHGKLPAARAYVFQKLVDVGLMRRLRDGGALVFWDVCDPVWWFNPADAREAAEAADGIVASCWPLADDFAQWSGRMARMIPDRVWLDHFTHTRQHAETRPVRLIWFGSAQNRIALYAAGASLSRLRANGHEVTLTLFDNAPESPMPGLDSEIPVYYTRWRLENEAETLAAHDIALLPSYPGPWGAVKSNNRTVTAMAAGLPVASGVIYENLRALVCDVQLRRETAAEGLREVREEWNVKQSAAEWRALIEEYENGRTSEVRSAAAVQV